MTELLGIANENEFYSEHYLAEFLAKDLKKADTGGRPRLDGLAREYLARRERWEKTRDPANRLAHQREMAHALLTPLGYTFDLAFWHAEAGALPKLAEVRTEDGAPACVVLEVLPREIDEDALTCQPHRAQYTNGVSPPERTHDWEEWISSGVFAAAEPPRWVILLAPAEALLIDRYKWSASRALRFDWQTLFTRRESGGLGVTAGLLARESLVPGSGQALLDDLDEHAHRHAFAVSEDLKYALRESVELLGNEVVRDLKERRKERVYERELAAQLTRDCLTYMYRLLFLFFVEARPGLGYAPMKSSVYARGYSLEALRDVVDAPLTSAEAENSDFLDRSLKQLFGLIWEGFPPGQEDPQKRLDEPSVHSFEIPPLKCHLFDPERTPLISRARLSNKVLRRVLRLMSLTRASAKSRRRGRVSYANLGINQLGAVYEALLAYRGFFAEHDLYEVKPAGAPWDPTKQGYFVSLHELGGYDDDEKVFDSDTGRVRCYSKGSFIYRLAGREREQTASYYTPESLTRCLVKYALVERLEGLTADEILKLTICEPAMGSAAFLNEAVNQLAEAYLQKKQIETGKTIPHEYFARELQRVRMRLADNNVFGADLNPTAVELAEVSLWLNAITEGAFVPWFGFQLVIGNSLIGARREVYAIDRLTANSRDSLWHQHAPERLDPTGIAPSEGSSASDRQGRVYHFLLPDPQMAHYGDKVICGLAPEATQSIRDWRKAFTKRLSSDEVKTVQRLSGAVDALWQAHAELLARVRKRTTDPLTVWPEDPASAARATTTAYKDKVLTEEIESAGLRHASPYRRLKLAMDYWCALWFWPIAEFDNLPSREQFWLDLALILEGRAFHVEPQPDLFPETRAQDDLLAEVERLGHVDVEKLIQQRKSLQIVEQLAAEQRFLHWELEFADLFATRAGFDLILGNPPWIKLKWDESGVMGDADPKFVLREHSAAEIARNRAETLERLNLLPRYLADYARGEGSQNFLNATQTYPLLKGVQSNSYKCFLPTGWRLGNEHAVTAYLHPEGVYDDPKGGRLRAAVYPRLRRHFQFQNEFALFQGTNDHGRMRFGLHIYAKPQKSGVRFATISNLFQPATVNECFSHHGHGAVPGIKTDQNKWETAGHKDRIVTVTDDELALFAKLYDTEGTPALAARLPALQAKQLLAVLRKFSDCPRRLGDLAEDNDPTVMFDETNAEKKDNTIRRRTTFPDDAGGFIVSGPHFFVGNPLYKTARPECTQNSHYDVIDLTAIPDDYRPRTNYVPVPDADHDKKVRDKAGLEADPQPGDEARYNIYKSRIPRVPWNARPVTDFYRVVNREMIGPSAERTLLTCMVPPGAAHINTVLAYAFRNANTALDYYAVTLSIPADFRVKSTGMGHANTTLVGQLPLLTQNFPLRLAAHLRALTLACLTTDYTELWLECWHEAFHNDRWTGDSPALDPEFFSKLTPDWQRYCALRTDYARRQALLELDVLVAQALGLTLDELITIYRVQFPVMRQYEKETAYDQTGRIVFTPSKGLPGIGFPRKEWNEIRGIQSGTVERAITDNTQPGGPIERTITYHAPFFTPDREADYIRAWHAFTQRTK